MNPTICKNCGLPIFHGAAGYVGPQCKCQFATLPQMYDTLAAENAKLRERVADLEVDVAKWKSLAEASQTIAEISQNSVARMDALKAQQKVVMPERKELPELMMAVYHEAKGWNACLDEFERLNRSKT